MTDIRDASAPVERDSGMIYLPISKLFNKISELE